MAFILATVEDPVALFTLVLAISTIGLWIVAWKCGIEQNMMTRKALAVTRISANAARDQAAITKRGLIDTEIAYIFCDHIDASWVASKTTEQVIKWVFTIIWRNSGHTPTRYGLSCVNKWDGSIGAMLPAEFNYPDYEMPGSIIIGPNAIMHSMGFEINVDKLEEIRQGIGAVYIWGWCDYNDVFDGTDRHRSEFCFEIIVSGNPVYKEGGFKYRRHGSFNGFDLECFRAPTSFQGR